MENKKCPCHGDYLDKLLQPAILSLLCEGDYHGFYLLNELERRGLISGADATGFYRTLHRLESDEKLSSRWEVIKGEKPRKIYAITEQGLGCLKNWQTTLRDYARHVEKMCQAIDRAFLKTE